MQLQKGASGLLGWLALKVTGRNPPLFGDSVVPTIEVGDNYLLAGEFLTETVTGTFTTGNQDSSTMSFTVPNGKVYRVLSIGADLSLDAADKAFVASWAAFISLQGQGAGYIAASLMDPVGNVGRAGALYLARPLLLPPAARMNVFVRTGTVLSANATVHAYMVRQTIDA